MSDREKEKEKETTPNYITPRGMKKLVDEITFLGTVERPRVTQEVTDAAAQGDRSENAEYIYGKKRLREIDRRMRFLRKRIEAAVVVDPAIDRGDRVYFGATVVVEDESGKQRTYQLVGEDEIDTEEARISWRSPVGTALLRKNCDDEVTVRTPGGTRKLLIIEVRYE
jgi:transcription elongation factor GreB